MRYPADNICFSFPRMYCYFVIILLTTECKHDSRMLPNVAGRQCRDGEWET